MESMVTITAARLAELEAAEARLKEQRAKNISKLNKFKEANPERVAEASSERLKRWYTTNREEYNAKRREKYRIAKESAAAASVTID